MKSKIIAALLFSASVASACPNLSGSYSCYEEDGTKTNLTVNQLEENGTTTYTLGDDKSTEVETLIADGVARSSEEKYEENGTTETVYTTQTWTCADANLKGDYVVRDEMSSGVYLIDATVLANLNADNNFQTVTTGTIKDVNGKILQNINQTSSCTRTPAASQL